MLQPLFRHDKIKSFLGIFQHHVRRLQEHHLRAVEATDARPGQAVNLHKRFAVFTKLTMDIIGVSAFSYNFDALAPVDPTATAPRGTHGSASQISVMEALELLLTPPSLLYVVGIFFLPFFPHWPLPPQNRRRRAKRKLFQVVDAVLEAKLAPSRPPPTAATTPSRKMLDLVDLMLEESNDPKVSLDEARMHVMTFMLAGHETTSSMLSWVFAVLAQHPTEEAKARAECRQVLAANNDSWDWKALGELKYTTAVIHEVLRLFPTASQLSTRVCIEDNYMPTSETTTAGDTKTYFIPKGATVVVHTGSLHRNPKYWSQPNEFLPGKCHHREQFSATTDACPRVERFLEGSALFEADKALRGGQGNAFFYMPFSAGPKNCIGMRFAMAELQVVVAALLTRHSFRLTNNANVLPTMVGVTMRPRHLDMTVHVVD
ncbi:hypothetical protein DYB32_008652 [Aphanomyces invadans]|uniref:Cytochrome P450 n=1 Tax=Aphanomyces invadans TaxID=157072 RepID=A0A3R6WGG1_9STRA|nr:hypothetical protein DYB32_008652 [Aphanomyces invadans]